MKEDWDNVIILDGCRYDLFEEANTLDGDLECRISLGSATPEYLTRNFDGKTFADTVYVTANPMYKTRDLEGTFFKIIDVWDSNWDSDNQTVRPEAMVEATVEAHKEHPNKRIISHFMQPHYPFIGEKADEIGSHSGYELAYRRVQGKEVRRDNPTVWELLEQGKVSKDVVWDAYQENLEIALEQVEVLLDELEGKTVVTSDHGNALGERPFPFGKRMYGHPVGMRHDSLCKVPWLVKDPGSRKNIIEEKVEKRSNTVTEKVEDRLSDLGYADL